ncbi:hypothetical protein CANCADRAFT_17112, partial [Tortispora caseinolytica NRRL Y-17796]
PPPLPLIYDKKVKERVFVHKSYGNEKNVDDNERLEFLGDSYLNHIVTNLLYDSMQNAREGELTILRSRLVSNETGKKLSDLYELHKKVKVGNSLHADVKSKIFADLFEAYIGGIVQDCKYSKRDPYPILYAWLGPLFQPLID